MIWELESLQKVSQICPEMVESAMTELWKIEPELRKTVVINAYIDEKINLSKASELLSVSRFELEKELREKGIPEVLGVALAKDLLITHRQRKTLRLFRSLSKEDVIAEVEAIRESVGWVGQKQLD